jgi:hypothetical protein
MPPLGHDQLTRHLGTGPVACVLAAGTPGRLAAGHSRLAENVVMHGHGLRPGGEAVGRSQAGTAHLAGNGARTADRPSSGPEGDR